MVILTCAVLYLFNYSQWLLPTTSTPTADKTTFEDIDLNCCIITEIVVC